MHRMGSYGHYASRRVVRTEKTTTAGAKHGERELDADNGKWDAKHAARSSVRHKRAHTETRGARAGRTTAALNVSGAEGGSGLPGYLRGKKVSQGGQITVVLDCH